LKQTRNLADNNLFGGLNVDVNSFKKWKANFLYFVAELLEGTVYSQIFLNPLNAG